MTEQLIIEIAKQRAKNQNIANFQIVSRNYTIQALSSKEISSFNQFHYVVDCPKGLSIESYLGEFDLSNSLLPEQVTEHKGSISITNHTDEDLTVSFVVLILQASKPDPIAAIRLTQKQKEDAESLGLTASEYVAFRLQREEALKKVFEATANKAQEMISQLKSKFSNLVGVVRLTEEEAKQAESLNKTPSEYLDFLINS
jgi:hypothetical protein